MIVLSDFKQSDKIIETLNSHGLVIFPCETVYGIACDSNSSEAVSKLNKYKKRPLGKPYAIMVSSKGMAKKYVSLNKTAEGLYDKFLPGPLTVVSKGLYKVASGIQSEIGTLGVRIPDYLPLLKLIQKFGRPIVATSANASYKKRPYKVTDVLDNISNHQKSLIDLVIDVGELPHNDPSTVIDTTLDEPTILRQGEIKFGKGDRVLSRNEDSTKNIAKELFQKYGSYLGERPIVFALEGEMGVGKTQFTKGLAKAMGLKAQVVSPTYNLVAEYDGKLAHIDAWRLLDGKDLDGLGFVKFVETKNLVISIEWADRVIDTIKKFRNEALIVWVQIKYGKQPNDRIISWTTL